MQDPGRICINFTKRVKLETSRTLRLEFQIAIENSEGNSILVKTEQGDFTWKKDYKNAQIKEIKSILNDGDRIKAFHYFRRKIEEGGNIPNIIITELFIQYLPVFNDLNLPMPLAPAYILKQIYIDLDPSPAPMAVSYHNNTSPLRSIVSTDARGNIQQRVQPFYSSGNTPFQANSNDTLNDLLRNSNVYTKCIYHLYNSGSHKENLLDNELRKLDPDIIKDKCYNACYKLTRLIIQEFKPSSSIADGNSQGRYLPGSIIDGTMLYNLS